MTIQELQTLLERQEWKFAKTMPHSPHWYTLKASWVSVTDFENAVLLIRKWGYDYGYGSRTFRYLDMGCWHYWTMGAPLQDTILINRTPVGA